MYLSIDNALTMQSPTPSPWTMGGFVNIEVQRTFPGAILFDKPLAKPQGMTVELQYFSIQTNS